MPNTIFVPKLKRCETPLATRNKELTPTSFQITYKTQSKFAVPVTWVSLFFSSLIILAIKSSVCERFGQVLHANFVQVFQVGQRAGYLENTLTGNSYPIVWS